MTPFFLFLSLSHKKRRDMRDKLPRKKKKIKYLYKKKSFYFLRELFRRFGQFRQRALQGTDRESGGTYCSSGRSVFSPAPSEVSEVSEVSEASAASGVTASRAKAHLYGCQSLRAIIQRISNPGIQSDPRGPGTRYGISAQPYSPRNSKP